MSKLSEVTPAQREQLRKNTARMAGGLPFIKYDEGKFLMGSADVTGNDFVAVIDRCEAVWLCSLSDPIEELARGNMMDGKIPSRPKGYDDQEKWGKWATGKNVGQPRDPLWLQYELPLLTDDGRIIIFKASTVLAKEAVQRLLDKANSQENLRRPFVTVEVNPNPHNIHQMLPDLTITGYSDDLDDVVLPGDKKPTNGGAPNESAPPRSSDMDDSIPF